MSHHIGASNVVSSKCRCVLYCTPELLAFLPGDRRAMWVTDNCVCVWFLLGVSSLGDLTDGGVDPQVVQDFLPGGRTHTCVTPIPHFTENLFKFPLSRTSGDSAIINNSGGDAKPKARTTNPDSIVACCRLSGSIWWLHRGVKKYEMKVKVGKSGARFVVDEEKAFVVTKQLWIVLTL